MLAFSSIFFMGGIMGKFTWPIPAVVIICLFASWLECFFLLPNHLAEFGRIPKKKSRKRWYVPLLNGYERVLNKTLKSPIITTTFFISVLLISLFSLIKMPKELFPGDDVRLAMIKIKGEVGTPLAITDDAVQKMDKIIIF